MSTVIVAHSDAELADLIARPYALVAFTSLACGPCRLLKPHLPMLARNFGNDDVAIVTADQDATPTHLSGFSIATGMAGFPFVAFLRKGELQDAFVGFKPLAFTTERLQRLIA